MKTMKLETPCIEWAGCLTQDGYGQRAYKGKVRYTHRIAYCEHHGIDIESIKGIVIRHKCDNPPCMNPEHLEPGTHADNARDRSERDRTARGQAAGLAKLTAEQVSEIRRRYKRGSRDSNTYTLSAEYGIDQTTVARITRGETWKGDAV